MWSIITVAKGMWPVTQRMLDSLVATLPAGLEFQLMYVDNGSPAKERSLEQFGEWTRQHKQIKYIGSIEHPPVRKKFFDYEFDYGVGLSTAWNDAIRNTIGDKILIVNNDLTFAKAGWLEEFDKALNNQQIGVVGVTGMSWHSTAFIQGSLMGIRRQVFDQVGLFDEMFEFSCEEVDLHRRIQAAGYFLNVIPEVKDCIQHTDGSTRRYYKDAEWYMMYLAHEARLRYCYKWPELGQPSIHD